MARNIKLPTQVGQPPQVMQQPLPPPHPMSNVVAPPTINPTTPTPLPTDYSSLANKQIQMAGGKIGSDGRVKFTEKELGTEIAALAQNLYQPNIMGMPKIKSPSNQSIQAGTTANSDMEGAWGKPSGGKKPQRRV